ncbi:MAG: long-chain fatty acid--CoA ligase [Candidatus Dadabacteria bacterium]|nr:MAG: long-chain fatty acid--CoA ligase [Candidatus Dadabacteria bacterium]
MPIYGPELDDPVSIPELLRYGLENKPDEDALISLDTGHTWRELDESSTRLARNYLALGLEPGDRIASLMPNRTALIVHYIACMKSGLIGVPLNYRYMSPEIDHALEVSGASALIAHAERAKDISNCKNVSKLPLGTISYGAKDSASPSFEELVTNDIEGVELLAPDPNSPAFIFFTSGSTGPAKGVTHSYESLRWMFGSCAEGFEMNGDDTILSGSSISHIGGFIFSFMALSKGARVLVARRFDPDEIIPLLRENRPTVLCMIPAAMFRVIRDHGATREDFTTIRLCRSGSDSVPLELEREFMDLTGHPIDEGYGSSEIGLATLNPPSGVIKMGSIGPPLQGFVFSIRDEDGNELQTGEDGNAWIKTKSLMVGYWENPEATKKVITDGWFNVGDVLRADEDGYLWFKGRKKQIIVHDGSNICPQEVEGALLEHEAVELAGVVGIHDVMHGENVRAFITVREGARQPKVMELIKFARERVGYKAPEDIVILQEMPLNPTGKIDRLKLKRLAEEEHSHR